MEVDDVGNEGQSKLKQKRNVKGSFEAVKLEIADVITVTDSLKREARRL